jgi:tetratricopeptide (TPR) repeat protein
MALRLAVLGRAVESVPAWAFIPDASFPTRIFTMARVWPRYVELLTFPTQLSADYSPAVILPATGPTLMGAVGFAMLALLALLVVATWRRQPELAIALGWIGIALLPVSNLLFVAEIVLAERTLYLPSVGVSIAAALAVERAQPRLRRALVGALGVWVVAFAGVTVAQNPVWRSTQTVFEDLRRNHPESARLLWEIGSRYQSRGDWPEARRWYERSFQIWPYRPGDQAAFAVALQKHGELAAAELAATRAVEMRPENTDHHTLLALIRFRRGQHAAAAEAAERGLAVAGKSVALLTIAADSHAAAANYHRAARLQADAVRAAVGRQDSAPWLRLARYRVLAGDTAGALAVPDEARTAGVSREVLETLRARLGEVLGPEAESRVP